MRKFFLAALAIVAVLVAGSAVAQSCCQKPVKNDMKMLAVNKSFRSAHEPPLPISYAPAKGKSIQLPVPGGADASAFYVPADEPSDNVLFVFHEWWGLNDYIRREAEEWQKLLDGKVDVYAIDLYDGKTAVTPEEAGRLMSNLDPKRGEAIIRAMVKNTGNKKIATIGWCMGGSWSFTGSVLCGEKSLACVMYYGFPEKNPDRIKPLKCDVLYLRANQDNFIHKKDVDEFVKRAKVTGHTVTVQSFDAVHAFANPSNPKHDAKASAEAQRFSLQFLKTRMGF